MGRGGRQTYTEHAAEAARLARRAATGEEREAYERIAAVWTDLADADTTREDEGETADSEANGG